MTRAPARAAWALLLVAVPLASAGVAQAAPVSSVSSVSASGPSRLDRDAARAQLVEDVRAALSEAGFDEGRVGVHVVSLEDGEELFAQDAEALLNPASNVKLFTAAAALEMLGPEYRWATEVWADARPDADGVIRGNLYLKGLGDPTFVTERMYRLVDNLWYAGVRRVTGDVVIDDTFFDDVREGPGWDQEESDRAYIAPTGALSLNFNSVAIHVRPGSRRHAPAEVTVDPASDFFLIDNDVKTVSGRYRRRLVPSSIPAGDHQRIHVRGYQPLGRDGAVYYRRVDRPALYFAHTFKTFMARRGVRFDREAALRSGVVPESASLLERALSQRLAEAVVTLNKVSNNHIAEQLLKTLGAEVFGAPGSWQKGVAAVERYLQEEVGIPRGSYVMRNGSGLNDTNRFSARQVTRLLQHVWRHFQVAPELVSSLSVAGRDGTARWRMDGTAAAGLLRAKTGTLENVSALSGFVSTAAGEVLAFSILVNDEPGGYARVVQGVDGVATAVARFGLAPGAEPAREPVWQPEVPVTPSAEGRVRTYLALGRDPDPRDLRFLRSALRTETDPVARAVVAEAIYRLDPAAGRRFLLEAFEPDVAFLARLGMLRPKGGDAMPVLGTLADLAAEGDAEALARLLAAAPVAEASTSAAEVSLRLVEVGRTAPGELLEALTRVDREAAARALALLMDGLRRDPAAAEEEGGHPFGRVLAEALSAGPESGSPAREEAADGEGEAPDREARVRRLRAMADVWRGRDGEAPPPPGVQPAAHTTGADEASGGGSARPALGP